MSRVGRSFVLVQEGRGRKVRGVFLGGKEVLELMRAGFAGARVNFAKSIFLVDGNVAKILTFN